MILARDRFGICPLYWSRQATAEGECLLFASEIKGLLASGLVQAQPDPRGINHVFTFFALPGPVTCFKGVELLQPGHFLTIASGQGNGAAAVRDKTYWEIDFPNRGEEERGDYNPLGGNGRSKTVDEFEQVMLRSVERRLRADVPVVSYLSGGVDSSVVVALATHLRKQSTAPDNHNGARRVYPNIHHLDSRPQAERTQRSGRGRAPSQGGNGGRGLWPAGGVAGLSGIDSCRGRTGD